MISGTVAANEKKAEKRHGELMNKLSQMEVGKATTTSNGVPAKRVIEQSHVCPEILEELPLSRSKQIRKVNETLQSAEERDKYVSSIIHFPILIYLLCLCAGTMKVHLYHCRDEFYLGEVQKVGGSSCNSPKK